MTTQKISQQYDAGAHLYVTAFNSSGQVFDYNTNTWVAISLPPVNPFLSVTERTGTGGTGESDFWATVDLGLLNPSATQVDVRLKFFERAGGSNSLSADTVIGVADVSIVSGGQVNVGFTECVLTPSYRAGSDTLYFVAQLRVNGLPVTLAGGDTCTIIVRQINPVAGSNLFTVGPVNPDANGEFTLSKVNPNLNADTSIYRGLVTMVVGSVTYSFECHFPSYA